MTDEAPPLEESAPALRLRFIVAALAAAALIVFIFQNTQDVRVKFLWLDGTPPLFLLLLITVGLTLVLTTIVVWWLRRRS